MKKIKIKIIILLLLIASCFSLVAASPANAGTLSLSIDPSIIEVYVLPPSNATGNLSIQNKSDTQVALQIKLREFRPKGENGELEYLSSNPSILNNVYILDNGIPVQSITLGPGQQKILTLNIIIPQDTKISARPPATSSNQSQINQAGVADEVGRDYYFSIIFVSDNTSSPTSTASLNQLGIATNVLLSVGAKEAPDAVIEEFSADFFYESGPVPFTVRIKNKGTQFIKPKGEITIKNMFGQSIGKLDLVSANVLASSARAISDANYVQELRMGEPGLDFRDPKALWKEDFLLGFYTATLTISLTGNDSGFTKSIHFFAFPFQGLIVIIFAIIAGIIIKRKLKAHMKK